MPVIVYGRGDCSHTTRARKALYAEGKAVDYRDVAENPAFLEEMLKITGGSRKVPVIIEKGKVTIGFEGVG